MSVRLFAVLLAVAAFAPGPFVPPAIPDLCATGTATKTASTGNWNTAGTWTPSGVPGAGARVTIPNGVTVTYDLSASTEIDCIDLHGVLTFVTGSATALHVTNLQVRSDGELIVGTAGAPITSTVSIVINDVAPDAGSCCPSAGTDPEQYGTGIIAWGKVQMHGATKTPTWVRLTEELDDGETVLTVATAPSGWANGDTIVIPDTRTWTGFSTSGYTGQYEEETISSISSADITISAGLTYDHVGARDYQGTIQKLPHVANLTRNIVVSSENAAGTRGHLLFTDQADVDIRYAQFSGLGRTLATVLHCTLGTTGTLALGGNCSFGSGDVTQIGTNQIGRYPIHFHHLRGPASPPSNGYQFTFTGNTVNDCTKWCVAVHNSHYGLIDKNVLYDGQGALLMTEDGSESENVIEQNIAIRATGKGGRDSGGREAVGFYFRGPNNYVRDNVACNILNDDDPNSGYGFKYFSAPGEGGDPGIVRIPNAPGVDTTDNGNVTQVNLWEIPILEFDNNEVYGATESGITWWWIGAATNTPVAGMATSTLSNTVIWHISNKGAFNYPSSKLIIDGFTVYGQQWAENYCSGFEGGDYLAHDLIYRNWNIQGCWHGMHFSVRTASTASPTVSIQTLQDSFFANYYRDIEYFSQLTSDGDATANMNARHVYLDNVEFGPWTSRHASHRTIAMITLPDEGGVLNYTNIDEMQVSGYVYDGTPSAGDFQVFYPAQAASYVMPQTVMSGPNVRVAGCPDAGLTNTQCLATHGDAMAGGIADCEDSTSRPEITGFTCDAAAAPRRFLKVIIRTLDWLLPAPLPFPVPR